MKKVFISISIVFVTMFLAVFFINSADFASADEEVDYSHFPLSQISTLSESCLIFVYYNQTYSIEYAKIIFSEDIDSEFTLYLPNTSSGYLTPYLVSNGDYDTDFSAPSPVIDSNYGCYLPWDDYFDELFSSDDIVYLVYFSEDFYTLGIDEEELIEEYFLPSGQEESNSEVTTEEPSNTSSSEIIPSFFTVMGETGVSFINFINGVITESFNLVYQDEAVVDGNIVPAHFTTLGYFLIVSVAIGVVSIVIYSIKRYVTLKR